MTPAAALVAQADPIARRLAALKRRAGASSVAMNDLNVNVGQRRSDFRKTP